MGQVSQSETLWVARQVIRQHELEPVQSHEGRAPADQWTYPAGAAGRCAQCPGDDAECRMLVWARAELAAGTVPVNAGGHW